MKALEVERLTKVYPKFTLDNVSFSVEEGRIAGLIGRNGAGKSTALRNSNGIRRRRSRYILSSPALHPFGPVRISLPFP